MTPRARCRRPCSATRNCRTSLPFSVWMSCPRKTSWSCSGRRKIQRFLSQPFTVAETFTGAEGKYVSLQDTIRAFNGIVAGDYDALPEQAFYMVGPIEEAVEKAKTL